MPGIDHLMINANRYEASVKFYSWLMPKIGYPEKHEYEGEDPVIGFAAPRSMRSRRRSRPTAARSSMRRRRIRNTLPATIRCSSPILTGSSSKS